MSPPLPPPPSPPPLPSQYILSSGRDGCAILWELAAGRPLNYYSSPGRKHTTEFPTTAAFTHTEDYGEASAAVHVVVVGHCTVADILQNRVYHQSVLVFTEMKFPNNLSVCGIPPVSHVSSSRAHTMIVVVSLSLC